MNTIPSLVKVDFIYLPVINFALQQNRVSVVRLFGIENTSDKDLHRLEIQLKTVPGFAETTSCHIAQLAAGERIRIQDLRLKLSTPFFIQLTERLTGSLSLEVYADGEAVFKEDYPIDVLAFDQWSGSLVLPEALSAFITPNHPALNAIQHRAAEILEKMTGTSALDEYQSRSPNRVKAQMAAVYTALAEQDIIYNSAPASFEAQGQRLRLVDSVLSQKMGNCLDLTLLYASCLEAIGIHPLIILTRGHAFAGAWLIPDTFPDSVIDDSAFLSKRTAEGINEILLVEATCMTKDQHILFDEAVKRADNHLRKTDDFTLALDVKRSRFSGIRPLPQRVLNGGQWEIQGGEPDLSEQEIVNPKAVNPYDLSQLSPQVELTKQLMWERKLLDLSLRNNLLNTRITRNTLQLISADLDKLEDALADGDEFRLLPRPADWDNPLYDFGLYSAVASTDPIVELVKLELTQKRLRTYLPDQDLDKTLKQLYRSSRLSLEENGANTLYMALGLLRWYETPGSERPRYAPILLLPVEMIRKSAATGYIIRSREEEAMLNITLLEMLRQNFGIHVPNLDSLPQDEKGVDVRLVYAIVRESIKNQSRWDVEEQAVLGIFSFSKFIMWNDIHNNADKLIENKLVRSLVNGKVAFAVEDAAADAVDLDKNFSPADIVLPISADASQLEAVYEAMNEKTYILHGPPGTGKSQTITNIIANALYQGKRVLFVAEKMAALSVVQSRLEKIGLAPFCLELHSNKAKKTAVLSQLKASTEAVKSQAPENFRRDAQRLYALRRELSVYVEALHKPYPFGLSLYQAITKYQQLEGLEALKFPATLLPQLTTETSFLWQDTLDLLVSVGKAFGHPAQHPLGGLQISQYNPELKDQIARVLQEALPRFSALHAALDGLRSLTGAAPQTSYTREQTALGATLCRVLQEIPELMPELLRHPRPGEALAECKELVQQGKSRDRCKEEVLRSFTEGLFAVDAKVVLNTWNAADYKWFVARWRIRKKIRAQLGLHLHKGSIKQVDIRNLLTNLISYQEAQKWVAAHSDTLSVFFGRYAKPGQEQWEQIQQIIEVFATLDATVPALTRDLEQARQLKAHLAAQLTGGVDAFRVVYGKALNELPEAWAQAEHSVAEIARVAEADAAAWLPEGPAWIEEILHRLQLWSTHLDQLKDWYQWLLAARKAEAQQLGFVAEAYVAQNIPTSQLKDSFYKGFYRAAIAYIMAKEPQLGLFKGKLFNDMIAKYKDLNDDFTKLAQKELYAKLAANIPSFSIEAVHNSEVGILQRNIKSNGRGTSIRKLFDQIPNLLPRMCPCMLMSPISVAQYIAPDAEKFDLIVFDEASQMPTYEAVGAIARGKNMIIVGDPKQMPPTNFFTTNTVDEEHLDKEDLESILDDSLALSIPSRYLLWHYRSKHESLIAFSNAEYYENKLLTFPSPDNIESKVRLVQIEGVYDKGKSRQNRREAEAVVREIERRLSDEKLRQRSIGVVTFSSVQQILVEDLLSDLFVARPDLERVAMDGEEPLFIKNLENVQGDERDIILFSVGYGPDAQGRVSMNFGPLNREGGERRLNVAVSRSRYEMIIFSTLRSEHIDLNRTSALGVSGLKRFLEFAEKGERARRSAQQSVADNQAVEHLIAEKLRARGYEVHTHIGASGYKIDLGVVDESCPEKYLLGIVCDGETYKRTKTARDREITQSGVLRMLGWRLCRVWTLDWWENPDEVLQTIEAAIAQAKRGEPEPPLEKKTVVPPPPVEPPKAASANEGLAAILNVKPDPVVGEPYVPARLPASWFPTEAFTLPQNVNYIIKQIQTVVATEAPLSKALLCKRILQAWRIARLGTRVEEHLDVLIRNSGCYQSQDGEALFVWKNEEQKRTYQSFRPHSERTAADLPPLEVANAVKHIVNAQISLPTKDLARNAAQLFGFSRAGAQVEAVMYQGIQEAVSRGYIEIDGGRAVIMN
jgi:Superfamily I DNA and RNA helicases and helicase subunits